jgi:hypothetical protein
MSSVSTAEKIHNAAETNIGGRSSQTQLCQLRCFFAINGKLHVSALIGHRQVFSQIT